MLLMITVLPKQLVREFLVWKKKFLFGKERPNIGLFVSELYRK